MTARLQNRHAAIITLVVIGGLGPAHAADDVFGEPPPHRVRVIRRTVRDLPPPPAIVSGYLPRNNAVPLYNEPPRLPSPGLTWR
jgi:hypothetical protein